MSFESTVVSVGIIGQAVFFSRFLVQWLNSEKEKKSVIPVSFWYLSLAGSFILLAYAVIVKDPVFIAGQSAGFIIYLRNLYFIAAERGVKKSVFTYFSASFVIIYLTAASALAWFAPSFRQERETAHLLMLYLLGLSGQFFFFLRFFVQWICTEKLRRSVVPAAFWYFSLVGSVLLLAYSVLVDDIVFTVGQIVGIFIYLRNIYFIYKERSSVIA
ncbi:lipid-A-disaccharide synthase N-terminal domain-containing protein [Geovibrio thiophilus]|nr:lipid-A-disaccharide synthase N-terminal domain-containing protein [Geovibrio thiophilus]